MENPAQKGADWPLPLTDFPKETYNFAGGDNNQLAKAVGQGDEKIEDLFGERCSPPRRNDKVEEWVKLQVW